jgi:hypothetical protein
LESIGRSCSFPVRWPGAHWDIEISARDRLRRAGSSPVRPFCVCSAGVGIRRSGRECLVPFVGGELNPKLAAGRLRFEVRRQFGQAPRDHDEVGIKDVDWLDVTIDCQATLSDNRVRRIRTQRSAVQSRWRRPELSIRTFPLRSQRHSIQRLQFLVSS